MWHVTFQQADLNHHFSLCVHFTHFSKSDLENEFPYILDHSVFTSKMSRFWQMCRRKPFLPLWSIPLKPINWHPLCLSAPHSCSPKREEPSSTSETRESLLSVLLRQECWVRGQDLASRSRSQDPVLSVCRPMNQDTRGTRHLATGWVHMGFTDFPSTKHAKGYTGEKRACVEVLTLAMLSYSLHSTLTSNEANTIT